MKVLIVEMGEYSDRSIELAAISIEAAFAAVKAKHSYIQKWSDPEMWESGDFRGYTWTGTQAPGRGRLLSYDIHFEATEYEVEGT